MPARVTWDRGVVGLCGRSSFGFGFFDTAFPEDPHRRPLVVISAEEPEIVCGALATESFGDDVVEFELVGGFALPRAEVALADKAANAAVALVDLSLNVVGNGVCLSFASLGLGPVGLGKSLLLAQLVFPIHTYY